VTRTLVHRTLDVLRAAAELVLPGACGACSAPGAPLCPGCRAGLRRAALPHGPGSGAPAVGETVPCWSAVRLEEPVRTAVSAYKDNGRRDLAVSLAPVLATAVGRVCREDPVLRRARARREQVLVVPVPPAGRARRRRGDDPVGDLVRAAVALLADDTLAVGDVLRHTRRVADQAHLGRAARAANLEGALAVHPAAGPAVRGSRCLVVDDVVTTGATLHAAADALREAGAVHVVGATLAVREAPHRGRSCGAQDGRLASMHEAFPLGRW
jgi:predicted amidophosphoribosyltransferase